MQNQAPNYDPKALSASLAALSAGNNNAPTSAPAKDKATVYVAVGFLREDAPDINSEDFDPMKHIINLPQLQGLDNMNPDTRKAGSTEFAERQADSNELLEDLTSQALATLEPGQTRILGVCPNGLVVSIYRKKDEIVAQPKAERTKRNFFAAAA